jgi:hypothetical protein
MSPSFVRLFTAQRLHPGARLLGLLIAPLSAGVVALIIDVRHAEWIVQKLGFWVLAVLLIGLVFSLWHGWRSLAPLLALTWRAGSVIAGLTVLLHLHFPHEFKIFMDELVLLGTSKVIHEEREVATPLVLQDIGGAVKVGYSYIDKRPFFHAFLLSLVHDLTGYRVSNGILLNALLTPLLLLLVFWIARALTGREAGGIVAVLLLSAVPLVAHNVTGGGFEILNLVMLLTVLLLAIAWNRTGDLHVQLALVLSGMLLAYTRYESVLYLLSVAGLLAGVWWRNRAVVNHRLTWVYPVLLIPLLCIFRVVSSKPEEWFQLEFKGSEQAFALANIAKNLPHALSFFFANDALQLGSWVVSWMCAFALVFGVLLAVRATRERRVFKGVGWTFGVVFAATLINLLVLLAYHWGQLDDYLVSRLALPFYGLAIILVTIVASQFTRPRHVMGFLGGIAAVSAWVHAIPNASRNHGAMMYSAAREYRMIEDFLREHPRRDYVVLTQHSLPWIVHGVWADSLKGAVHRPDVIRSWASNGRYSDVYVVHRLKRDPETDALVADPVWSFGEGVQLERIDQRRISDRYVTRISKLVVTGSSHSVQKPDSEKEGETPPAAPEPGA